MILLLATQVALAQMLVEEIGDALYIPGADPYDLRTEWKSPEELANKLLIRTVVSWGSRVGCLSSKSGDFCALLMLYYFFSRSVVVLSFILQSHSLMIQFRMRRGAQALQTYTHQNP